MIIFENIKLRISLIAIDKKVYQIETNQKQNLDSTITSMLFNCSGTYFRKKRGKDCMLYCTLDCNCINNS